MKASNLLGVIFVAAFALSSSAFASSSSSSSSGGSSDRGDSTRERGDASDRGARGELNHDNELQGAEQSSDAQRRSGTPLNNIRVGTPNDPKYLQEQEELRNHR